MPGVLAAHDLNSSRLGQGEREACAILSPPSSDVMCVRDISFVCRSVGSKRERSTRGRRLMGTRAGSTRRILMLTMPKHSCRSTMGCAHVNAHTYPHTHTHTHTHAHTMSSFLLSGARANTRTEGCAGAETTWLFTFLSPSGQHLTPFTCLKCPACLQAKEPASVQAMFGRY